MRIRNRPSNSGGDSALHQGREQRAITFRNQHHLGEHVTGRFLKQDVSGYAWVAFAGLPLLAKIEKQPRPGTLLHFIIKALSPDIILKEVRGNASSNGPCQAQIVVDFDAARTAFESAARPVILAQPNPLRVPMSLKERRNALLSALTPKMTELYTLTTMGQAAINTHLAHSGPGRFYYLPWLLPALRCDLIMRSETKPEGTTYQELAFGFDAPTLGPGQLRILSRTGRTGVRVLLEESDHLPQARAILKALGQDIDDSVTLIGADKPPQYAHGGVLSQLLANNPHKLMGLGS